MEPADKSPPDGDVSIPIITMEDLERIANPLTVVHGYTALLQRRLLRGQTIDDEELLRVLNAIEAASRAVSTALVALAAQSHSNRTGSKPE